MGITLAKAFVILFSADVFIRNDELSVLNINARSL